MRQPMSNTLDVSKVLTAPPNPNACFGKEWEPAAKECKACNVESTCCAFVQQTLDKIAKTLIANALTLD
jgi:hypothetical protein